MNTSIYCFGCFISSLGEARSSLRKPKKKVLKTRKKIFDTFRHDFIYYLFFLSALNRIIHVLRAEPEKATVERFNRGPTVVEAGFRKYIKVYRLQKENKFIVN